MQKGEVAAGIQSVTMAEKVEGLREWAAGHTVKAD
jgi:hypothetical protein